MCKLKMTQWSLFRYSKKGREFRGFVGGNPEFAVVVFRPW